MSKKFLVKYLSEHYEFATSTAPNDVISASIALRLCFDCLKVQFKELKKSKGKTLSKDEKNEMEKCVTVIETNGKYMNPAAHFQFNFREHVYEGSMLETTFLDSHRKCYDFIVQYFEIVGAEIGAYKPPRTVQKEMSLTLKEVFRQSIAGYRKYAKDKHFVASVHFRKALEAYMLCQIYRVEKGKGFSEEYMAVVLNDSSKMLFSNLVESFLEMGREISPPEKTFLFKLKEDKDIDLHTLCHFKEKMWDSKEQKFKDSHLKLEGLTRKWMLQHVTHLEQWFDRSWQRVESSIQQVEPSIQKVEPSIKKILIVIFLAVLSSVAAYLFYPSSSIIRANFSMKCSTPIDHNAIETEAEQKLVDEGNRRQCQFRASTMSVEIDQAKGVCTVQAIAECD